MLKKINIYVALFISSIVLVFITLYLPKTINNPNELNHIACGYPFQFLSFKSYRSPPFPWTYNCIVWVGEGLTDINTNFLKSSFVLDIAVVFAILTGSFYVIRLIYKRKINKKVLITTLVFLVLLTINYSWQYFHPRGSENKERAVGLYLEYLTKNDAQGIQQLTPENFDNNKEIRDLLDKFGGNTFENITVDFKSTESSTYWYATIKGLRIDAEGKKFPFTHTVTVEELDIYNFDDSGRDRWYIMIGKYNNPSLPVLGSPVKIEKVYKANTK